MTYNSDRHGRRSIRLRDYDYTQNGAYFVTICTQGRVCIFGKVVGGTMHLNEFGQIVQSTWDALPDHYPHVQLDAWIIMPNHVHGIIILHNGVRADLKSAPIMGNGVRADLKSAPIMGNGVRADLKSGPIMGNGVRADLKSGPIMGNRHGLPEIVRALKTFSSRRINELRGAQGSRLWQRNYWEHIIRNEADYERIRAYIRANPAKWERNIRTGGF